MKVWNFRLFRHGSPVMLGQVSECNETLARCAALHRFGVSDEELAAGEVDADGFVILPDDEFEVSPGL